MLTSQAADSYKVIQDQKAAIVFWTNRLDYVAEMGAIANGPWTQIARKFLGFITRNENDEEEEQNSSAWGKNFWQQIMELSSDDVDEGLLSIAFFAYTVLRILAAVFLIPLWFMLGLFTMGWFWPPQIREFIFTQKIVAHSNEQPKEDELRRTQVANLETELFNLKNWPWTVPRSFRSNHKSPNAGKRLPTK